MSPGATVLEAVSISKKFGHNVVMKDLSIRFTEARLHSILGPNGAGKTTNTSSMGNLISIRLPNLIL